MAQSIILKGLDLVRSKQEADPGSLSGCKNFEITNVRGLTKMQGMRSFSGGVENDVIDPYVLHSYGFGASYDPLDESSNLVDVVSPGTFTAGTIVSWGEGGNYDVVNGELTEVDGTGVVCFLRTTGPELMLIAICDIKGRLPATQDVITNASGGSARVATVPWLASKIISDGAPYAFGSYTDTVDSISQLIHDFDLSASTVHAWPIQCSPLGSVRGGFLFKDEKYFVADIETWSFTSGSEEPSIGDFFRLYYTGTSASGLSKTYTVERVITESGDWTAGTAAGKLELILNVSSGNFNSPINPTDTRNNTTATNNPLTISALVRSSSAALFKAAPLADGVSEEAYERQDLGYEVRFVSGDEYFTVLNRSNRDAQLEATVTTTDWTNCGTGSGWTNPSNITGTASDGTFASQANNNTPLPALLATNYGFNLPANAVVLGVEMRFRRRKAAAAPIGCRDKVVKLIGVPGVSQNKKSTTLWHGGLLADAGALSATYGSASDLWATSLSADIINSTGFGVSIEAEAVNGGEATNREIDSIELRITYKDRSSTVYFGDSSTTAITQIVSAATTATVTTTASHGFTTGQTVTIAGAAQAEYNGDYVITVTSLTVFTYTFAGSGTSPATGTITAFRNFSTARAIWYHKEKGDWSTADAQGTLTLYEVSSPSSIRTGQYIRASAGASGATLAIAASGAERVYLPPSNALEANASQWEFTREVNFFGSRGTEQVAGASGADLAFTWDGTYCIRMRTGIDISQDKPRHVAKVGDQLALGYIEGVTIFSDLGYPESYAGVVGGTLGGSSPISDDTATYTFAGGAQEIKHGDSVYGILPLADQNTAVFCRNSIQMVVGTGGSLVTRLVPGSSGIIEYTHADIGIPVFLDYRGIGTLSATAAFGDFARGRLSDEVSPWLIPRLQQNGASFVSTSGPIRSEVIRNKNQLRVYFRDRWCLTMTLVGNDFSNPQFTTQLLPFAPAMTFTGVTSGGKDLLFLAPYGMAEYGAFSNDLKASYEADTTFVSNANLYAPAFVYQGDVGTSWDNKLPIDGYIEINGGAAGREFETKHYDKMLVHGQAYGFAPFGCRFAVNYEEVGTGTPQNVNGGSTSGNGDLAFVLRPFSKVEKIRTSIGSDGYALTIQFVSSGASVYGATSTQTSPYKFRPFTIQSIIVISETLKTRPPNAAT